MRTPWITLFLLACTPSPDDTDDTDTDVDDTDIDDTDVDDTDVEDTDVEDTDDTDDTDVDVTDTANQIPPTLPSTSFPNYTTFFDGSALNIYWRAASDDVTSADMLEYQVTCTPPGALSGTVTMPWTVATSLQVEASSRYWTVACSGVNGIYGAWVTVRDAAGNETAFPTLTGEISAPK